VSSEAANEATDTLSIDRRGLDADVRRIARESRYGRGGWCGTVTIISLKRRARLHTV
jgi:hypothetical protein